MQHHWYWPFHSWKYSSSYDRAFPDRIWEEYRYCETCGREQSRLTGRMGTYFGWQDEPDSSDREQAQRYVEACAASRKSEARVRLIDDWNATRNGAPVSDLKKRIAEFEDSNVQW